VINLRPTSAALYSGASMCSGSDAGGDTPSSVERESGVDTFSTTEQVGPVSMGGHSDLSRTEAFSIANNPFSSLSTPVEKGLAVAQAVLPGGSIVGGLRGAYMTSPRAGSLLGSSKTGKGLLGG
jgi:hypothetical protein